MKLDRNDAPELVSDQNEDFESEEASIDIEDLAHIFDLLSTGFYSNPEGSIVREITSNCFDAHIEAEVTDQPVLIRFTKEDDQNYVIFQDFGIGMDPDRAKNIFNRYGASTKRASNAYIGAFGLGSKSPFSITNLFYIISAKDGIEYTYAYEKGTGKKPKLTPLVQFETGNSNGTQIKIPITFDQKSKLKREIPQQLRYFDNVVVLDFEDKISNDYIVDEYQTFRERIELNINVGTPDRFTKLHLCVGKVNYPISFDQIGIPAIFLPFALKFEIGDLAINPNRENINYNTETITVIKAKIMEFFIELQELASRKVNIEFEDLFSFEKALENRDKYFYITGSQGTKFYKNNDYYIKERAGKQYVNVNEIPFPIWKPIAHLNVKIHKSLELSKMFLEYKRSSFDGSLENLPKNSGKNTLHTSKNQVKILLDTRPNKVITFYNKGVLFEPANPMKLLKNRLSFYGTPLAYLFGTHEEIKNVSSYTRMSNRARKLPQIGTAKRAQEVMRIAHEWLLSQFTHKYSELSVTAEQEKAYRIKFPPIKSEKKKIQDGVIVGHRFIYGTDTGIQQATFSYPLKDYNEYNGTTLLLVRGESTIESYKAALYYTRDLFEQAPTKQSRKRKVTNKITLINPRFFVLGVDNKTAKTFPVSKNTVVITVGEKLDLDKYPKHMQDLVRSILRASVADENNHEYTDVPGTSISYKEYVCGNSENLFFDPLIMKSLVNVTNLFDPKFVQPLTNYISKIDKWKKQTNFRSYSKTRGLQYIIKDYMEQHAKAKESYYELYKTLIDISMPLRLAFMINQNNLKLTTLSIQKIFANASQINNYHEVKGAHDVLTYLKNSNIPINISTYVKIKQLLNN